MAPARVVMLLVLQVALLMLLVTLLVLQVALITSCSQVKPRSWYKAQVQDVNLPAEYRQWLWQEMIKNYGYAIEIE